MADIDLKTETPDTSLPATGFLFGADSQASASPSVYTTQSVATTLLGSTTLSGTTITANAPVVDFAQTWNNAAVTFTGAKLNITDTASNAASLLMDLQVGPSSVFSVRKNGNLGIGSAPSVSFSLNAVGAINASQYSISTSNGAVYWTDLVLTRRGAANLRLGAADAAAPVAQTLSVQGRTGTDAAATAYPFTIQGAQGTGTGAGGSIVFQVAPAGTAGSTPNGLVDAFTINSSRQLIAATSSDAAPAFAFSGATQTGLSVRGSVGRLVATGTGMAEFSNAEFRLGGASYFSWASNTTADPGAASDVRLFRDAANTLALRNGTAAQTFNVYNTFTDASNYERGSLNFASNIFRLETQQLGTGSARALLLRANELYLRVGTSGNGVGWNITSAGNLVATDDNTYDIGASGASRPRDLYIGRNIRVSSTSAILWESRVHAYARGAGILALYNSAENDFDRLQFGGTTSSFPALKRSTTFLQARLADDSAACGFSAANVQAATAYTVATLPTPATGMIARVTDATAPVIGATVTGGGAAYALVNYNGANWTVIGV
jgi:hypothetical protein